MSRFHKKKWSVRLNENTHACSIFVCIVIKMQGLVRISNCILITNTFSFCRSSNCKKRFMAGKFWHAFCVNYGTAYVLGHACKYRNEDVRIVIFLL